VNPTSYKTRLVRRASCGFPRPKNKQNLENPQKNADWVRGRGNISQKGGLCRDRWTGGTLKRTVSFDRGKGPTGGRKDRVGPVSTLGETAAGKEPINGPLGKQSTVGTNDLPTRPG